MCPTSMFAERWPGTFANRFGVLFWQGALTGRSACADKLFRNTGLERSAHLAQDVAWMQSEYGLAPVTLSDDGPGRSYARRGPPECPNNRTTRERPGKAEASICNQEPRAQADVGSYARRICPSSTVHCADREYG